jgi:hypothetical protein
MTHNPILFLAFYKILRFIDSAYRIFFLSSHTVSRNESQCPHTPHCKISLNFCICTVWVWHHLHLIQSSFITEWVTNCLGLWTSNARVFISFQSQLMEFMTKFKTRIIAVLLIIQFRNCYQPICFPNYHQNIHIIYQNNIFMLFWTRVKSMVLYFEGWSTCTKTVTIYTHIHLDLRSGMQAPPSIMRHIQ